MGLKITSLLLFLMLLCSNVPGRHLVISLKTRSGSFLTAENGGGGIINSNRTALNVWEKFVLLDLNEGELLNGDRIAIKASDGTFLSAENGGGGSILANRRTPAAWETFFIERLTNRTEAGFNDGDFVAIRTADNYYLTVKDGGRSPLKATNKSVGIDERFVFRTHGEPATELLSGPFTTPQMIIRPVVGIDEANLNGPFNICTNSYFGRNFPGCYAGHEGTDFLLAGHLLAQSLGSIDVYTVAGGKVVARADGNTDKCFFKIPPRTDADSKDFVFCINDRNDSNEFLMKEKEANFVAILQDDGIVAYYYHLKRDSIALNIGQRVECGQLVGKIGSSGISSAPHLHLTLLRVNSDINFPSNADAFKAISANRGAAEFLNPYKPMRWQQLSGVVPKKTCQANSIGSGPTCGLGQPCPGNICQIGLMMKDGLCKRIGIIPGKPCDENQICGPGLECRGGICKIPLPKRRS